MPTVTGAIGVFAHRNTRDLSHIPKYLIATVQQTGWLIGDVG
jgi:hypothetical protein